MLNRSWKQRVVEGLLPQVQTPGQYIGGELGAVVKDHRRLRGRLALAFPDAYTIGMSCHGLQVLYDVMNRRDDWACERVFAPLADMERLLREQRVPLYGLETFTPLAEFDVLGFTLQYELCASNVLTMLDLGGVPLASQERTLDHPLVIAGGPGAMNPEPMARFIDLFVVGDGEQALPEVCDDWLRLRQTHGDRDTALAEMAARRPYVYVPRLYRPRGQPSNGPAAVEPRTPDVPQVVLPAVLADLESVPPPTRPVVPHVESVQDRLVLEIMRGCPGRCRFCQSTTIKRPLRYRRVETIVRAAIEGYRNTGYNEISLLSLSTSDYPHFEELIGQLQETFRPLGVNISVPSLRINPQWRRMADLLHTDRRSGLTLAPEVARDDMREQVGKRITNDDLYEGCRNAFAKGFSRVKLYFMCGLPGERETDLDGIVEMAETISRLGKEVSGRYARVVANVSNFVPKPHTPYQFDAMRRRDYFRDAHEHLHRRKRLGSVRLRCHDVDSSLLEGVIARGDRQVGAAIEWAWRHGARFDAWSDQLQPELWWQAFEATGVDVQRTLHTPYPTDTRLPWDHIGIRPTRAYLEREHGRSIEQRTRMCVAGAGGQT